MRITITHTIDDLADDCRAIAVGAKQDMADVVEDNAKAGNRIAKAFATESAGSHGKHYPDRFSPEQIGALEWEYGPSGRPQGEMSFEFGSRNSPPHMDLNRSADIIGPKFGADVAALAGRWFWP